MAPAPSSLGGDFFAAGGAARQRVAEFDVATGALTAFATSFSGPVNALALSNGRLFAAGSFDRVSNEGRYGAAAITVATGAVLPWNPAPVGVPAALATTGNTVVLGGTLVGFGAVGRTNRRRWICRAARSCRGTRIPTTTRSTRS